MIDFYRDRSLGMIKVLFHHDCVSYDQTATDLKFMTIHIHNGRPKKYS
jgi:hypothetical protein